MTPIRFNVGDAIEAWSRKPPRRRKMRGMNNRRRERVRRNRIYRKTRWQAWNKTGQPCVNCGATIIRGQRMMLCFCKCNPRMENTPRFNRPSGTFVTSIVSDSFIEMPE